MSILAPITGIPGIRAAIQSTFRTVFKGGYPISFLPQGKLINGTLASDPTNTPVTVLQAGLVMGKVTATGLYANSIVGPTTVANAIGDVSITAAAATVTEVARRFGASGTFKLTGPPVAGGTVATVTVTYSAATGTTITCTALLNAFIAGSFIQPADGSEVPVTVIPDGSGIMVTDQTTGTRQTVQFPQIPIQGVIIAANIINYPTDQSLITWLKSNLCSLGGGDFQFDDQF